MGEGVGEAVGVDEPETDGVGDVDGAADGFGVAVGVGDGERAVMPLLHTSFLPNLMQVNFIPW